MSLPKEDRVCPRAYTSAGGPVVAVRTNPSDPYGKVLVVAGDDPNQLLTAARALALGSPLLQGDTARIGDFQLPAPRQPDDAPLWMKTNRVSSLWDYSQNAELSSDGSGPLPVYLRMPPDFYYGDLQSLPMHLDYRYNAISVANASTLRASVNGTLVNELPLPHQNSPKKTLSDNLAVPLTAMRPFTNTFLFNFYFQIAKSGYCHNTPPIDLQGSILRSSYVDLRNLNHWAEMPMSSLPMRDFRSPASPISRKPGSCCRRRPAGKRWGCILTLLAYFGEQTGYPALRVTVDDPSGIGSNADYLIRNTAGPACLRSAQSAIASHGAR